MVKGRHGYETVRLQNITKQPLTMNEHTKYRPKEIIRIVQVVGLLYLWLFLLSPLFPFPPSYDLSNRRRETRQRRTERVTCRYERYTLWSSIGYFLTPIMNLFLNVLMDVKPLLPISTYREVQDFKCICGGKLDNRGKKFGKYYGFAFFSPADQRMQGERWIHPGSPVSHL